jgi:hypothetical protein
MREAQARARPACSVEHALGSRLGHPVFFKGLGQSRQRFRGQFTRLGNQFSHYIVVGIKIGRRHFQDTGDFLHQGKIRDTLAEFVTVHAGAGRHGIQAGLETKLFLREAGA